MNASPYPPHCSAYTKTPVEFVQTFPCFPKKQGIFPVFIHSLEQRGIPMTTKTTPTTEPVLINHDECWLMLMIEIMKQAPINNQLGI